MGVLFRESSISTGILNLCKLQEGCFDKEKRRSNIYIRYFLFVIGFFGVYTLFSLMSFLLDMRLDSTLFCYSLFLVDFKVFQHIYIFSQNWLILQF